MKNTMNLLAKAEKVQDLTAWAKALGLSSRVLYTSKYREHLSPAVAGALAEEMGEDAREWMLVAALESERESACKARMVRSLMGRAAAACVVGAVGAVGLLGGPSPALASPLNNPGSVSYVKCLMRIRRAIMAALAHVSRTLPGAAAAL